MRLNGSIAFFNSRQTFCSSLINFPVQPLFFLLLSALILTPSFSARGDAVSTAKSPLVFTVEGSFTFNIPVGFMFQKQGGGSYPIFVNAPSNYTAYMQVATDPNQGSLQQFVQNEAHGFQINGSLSNVAFPAFGAITTTRGVKGMRLMMTFGSQKGAMEMVGYYFSKPGEVEVLHGFCFAPDAARMVPLFDNSANSMVLK
jgi:hypothetical protein